MKSIQIFKQLSKKKKKKVMRNSLLKDEIASLLAVKIRRPGRDFHCISLHSMSAHNRLTVRLKWAKGQQVQRSVQNPKITLRYCAIVSLHLQVTPPAPTRNCDTRVQQQPCALCCVWRGLSSRRQSLCFQSSLTAATQVEPAPSDNSHITMPFQQKCAVFS